MISLFELGHVDPIPINFVFVPSFMCLVRVYIPIYIKRKIIQLMPGAFPITAVISAAFFPDGRCQAWIEALCAQREGGGQQEEELSC